MCAAPPTLLQCSYEGTAWVGWHRSRRLGASSEEPGKPGERCAIRVSGMTRFEGLWSVLPTSIRSPFVPDRRVNSRSTARFPPFLDRTSAALHGSYLRQVQHRGGAMETTVHKHLIEQCLTMACASRADRDKALWLTMARSWVRLANEVERSEMAQVVASGPFRHRH